jgi:hypothetical protein
LRKHVVRKQGTNLYVDRWGGLRHDVAQALAFPSVEEADFHRGQLHGATEYYELCELTPDGNTARVETP